MCYCAPLMGHYIMNDDKSGGWNFKFFIPEYMMLNELFLCWTARYEHSIDFKTKMGTSNLELIDMG